MNKEPTVVMAGHFIDLAEVQAVERVGNMNLCHVYLKNGNKMTITAYREVMKVLEIYHHEEKTND